MSLSTVGKQVKYGLISKKPAAATTVPLKPRSTAFRADDSDEDDGNAANDIARVNAQLAKRRAADEAALLAAANEDPSIYDYDGSYDTFKAEKVSTHQLSQPTVSKEPPKSRYVNNLLSTAKMREKEKERVYEKKLLKERTEEDKEFGDKPKFMTSAYKKKLLEDQKWEYEDRLADEVEQRTDVRKSGMQGFYANLLTKNVAMGGDVDAHAVSVYTAGSARQTHLLDTPAPQSAHNGNKETGKMEEEEGATADEEEYEEVQGVSSVYQDTRAAHPDRDLVGEKRSHDDTLDSAVEPPTKKLSLPASTGEHVESASQSAGGDAGAASAHVQHLEAAPSAPTAAPAVPTSASTSTPAVVADKSEQILSAKDRYLARKKAAALGSN